MLELLQMDRARTFAGRTSVPNSAGRYQTSSNRSADGAPRVCATSALHPPNGDPRSETTGKFPAPGHTQEIAPTRVSVCRLPVSGPYKNDESRTNLRFPGGAWL